MKIDFSKVQIKDIEDQPMTVDISKELGNMMYLNAQDIAVADLGHDIYHKHEVERKAQNCAREDSRYQCS